MSTGLEDAILKITAGSSSYAPKKLPNKSDPVAIPARTGAAVPKAKTAGGGIASPLSESAKGRAYFAERYLKSTDGLIFARYLPIKSISMTDATGAAVMFKFEEPA